jgi:CRISPR system Cascade subunit CasC
LLRPELSKLGLDDDAVNLIVARSQEIGRESGREIAKSDEEGDPETAQLIFLSDEEVAELARKLAKLYRTHERKGFEKLKIEELTRMLGASVPRSVDISMFGRMTTSAAFENIDAAVQVAHAISTHAIEPEFDYYTAVDDISGESGAGFIGDTAFNSATYYKYLSIHWEGLIKNLGGDSNVAARAVAALIEAAAVVNPTGKQNSFAAHNLPDLVLVEVRQRNLPVSYANAFVEPVWTNGRTSLTEKSTAALASYMGNVNGLYNIEAERAWFSTNDVALPGATRHACLRDLLAWLPLNGEQAS